MDISMERSWCLVALLATCRAGRGLLFNNSSGVDCRVDEAIPVWSRQFCCHDFHEVGFAGPDFFFFFREICFVTWTDEYHHDADWESDDADWESDDANLADEARASDWAIDCACDRGIDCVCDRGIDCVYDMAIDYVFDRGTYFVFEMPETGHGHVCKKVTGHVWEVTGHDDGKATALCFVDKEIFADCYTTGHGHGRDQGSARVTRHDDGIPTELLQCLTHSALLGLSLLLLLPLLGVLILLIITMITPFPPLPSRSLLIPINASRLPRFAIAT
eukprot:CAMPEP_0184659686 /NCGR_PEP_ID=MMETSP0308-20130426/30665_1 /TAXON_ID=38269 /ORGANISM="Gloeochaete witrockiana, Strain SAG 46.84" /LENGTH=274 /DNA_ID=CAMNT_0027099705 /DNA_START=172 /DNA_END=992 /DNA_ORIENTATION=+